jgi:hypothetical protein
MCGEPVKVWEFDVIDTEMDIGGRGTGQTGQTGRDLASERLVRRMAARPADHRVQAVVARQQRRLRFSIVAGRRVETGHLQHQPCNYTAYSIHSPNLIDKTHFKALALTAQPLIVQW